ncbi:MAG: hypothetical protein HN341_07620 [Verrucomicrobia bacterium]|nr:hypothetical protein [Verrucomicrobiota bacterium]
MHKSAVLNFLETFYAQLDADHIVLVPVRPKALNDEEAFTGDYDFLASPESIDPILLQLFTMAAKACLNFTVNQVKYGKTKIYLYDPQDSRSVTLEIWSHLEVKDKGWLRYIFFEDVEPFVTKAPGLGYQFDPEVESLYYLSHLKTKRKDLRSDGVQERLVHYTEVVRAHPVLQELYARLAEQPGVRDEVAAKANAVLAEKGILFSASHREKRVAAADRYRAAKRHRIRGKWLRFLRITPVLGPDGVGKTSLINALKTISRSRVHYYRFKRLFRHNWLYQLSRAILKRRFPKTLQKNQYDDIHGTWLHTIAWIRYPLLVLFSLLSRRFMFSDRYYHDLLIKNTRFLEKQTRFRSNWKRLLRKSPGTFCLVQLDAPTDVIHSRKEELSAQAIDAYRTSVFEMYLKKPSIVYSYINTSLSLEHCSRALLHSSAALGVKP